MRYLTKLFLSALVLATLSSNALAQSISVGTKARTRHGNAFGVIVKNPTGIDRIRGNREQHHLEFGDTCNIQPAQVVSVVGVLGSQVLLRYQSEVNYHSDCPVGTLFLMPREEFFQLSSMKYPTLSIAGEFERGVIQRLLGATSPKAKAVLQETSQSCTGVRSMTFRFGSFRDKAVMLEVEDDGRASLSIPFTSFEPSDFDEESLRYMRREIEELASKKVHSNGELLFKFEGYPIWGPHEYHSGMSFKRLYFADCVRATLSTIRLIGASTKPVGYYPYDLRTR